MRRFHPASTVTPASLVFVSLASMGLGSCGFEPTIPTLRFELNQNEIDEYPDTLALDPVAQDQLRGALEMLFGTPSNPGYMLVEEWIDDERNPNYGDMELSEDQFDGIVADNTAYFAESLKAIEEGRFEDVRPRREALDMVDAFNSDLSYRAAIQADILLGEAEQAELDELDAVLTEEWTDALTNWYPSLRDSAELYRQQCLHCHGVSGGGDGPTARFLKPLPRDYRKGQFKFTALAGGTPPRREDLFRVLEEGIYMTAMPSFRRFSDAQLHGLVDYVRLLAIRGETEALLAYDYDENEFLPFEKVKEEYLFVWSKWETAADSLIVFDGDVPASTPERIAHGRDLFVDEASANCVKCHGTSARGDGASAFERNEDGELERVKDDWGNPIFVRDLTQGIYRFGRRPIDIYRRIHAGIYGTPMPSHSSLTDPDGNRILSDDDMWDIVHYVRSLSASDPTAHTGDADPAADGSHGAGQ